MRNSIFVTMSFCYFVLFCLILTHVSPNTIVSNYQINFLFETWIPDYSNKQSTSYLNKSQELHSALQSGFSGLQEKYTISIDGLTQGSAKSSNEFSIIAYVKFTGNSILEPQTMTEYLKKINASLLGNSISEMPISTDSTTNSISTTSSNPTGITNFTTVSTVSSIPSPTTGYSHYSNYTLPSTTLTSELNSSMSTESNNVTGTTVLSTIFVNENISSTSGYNTDSLSTLSNVTTVMPDVPTTNVNTTPSFENNYTLSTNSIDSSNSSNNSISSETTKVIFIPSTTESNISNFNSIKSTESSIVLQNSSSPISMLDAGKSTESGNTLQYSSSTTSVSNSLQSTNSTTSLQSKGLSTSFISSTVSSKASVGPFKNWTIVFKKKAWEEKYSNMDNPTTKDFVEKLIEEIAKALNVQINAVRIYSLKSGSIIVESGIQSNALDQAKLNSLLQNIDAEIIPPSTSSPTTTDSGLPTYAIALIAVFTTCFIIAIAFVATALICRYRRLKGYGRHEVEFFEMDDGWKKHSTRNPSFQMD